MDQYRPQYHARDYEDINRSLNREEFNEVWRFAKDVIGEKYLEPSFE